MANYIKQIKDSNGYIHDLDAKLWDGHQFSEITDLVHGVVDTYVIPAQSANKTDAYKEIVESSDAQIDTTLSKLKGLISENPDDEFDRLGVGDIILMGATSDGKTNFDRWVSYVGKETDPTIKLDVLETQVATHHHTISASGTSKALTGVNSSTKTALIPTVSDAVTVLTSAKGTFVVSVDYADDGENTMELSKTSHSHSVNEHAHTIKPSTLVSRYVSVYNTLTSSEYTPHTHSNISVAGSYTDGTEKTYVTGHDSTDTFVKTLKYTSTNTGGASGSTAGSGELKTSDQVSTDTVGSTLLTLSGGDHSHTITAVTTTSVVTAATVQASVMTSVSWSITAPVVAANVVTSVTKVAKTAASNVTLTGTKTFVNTVSVDDSGILSFGSGTVGISSGSVTISGISTITSDTQSAGSTTISADRQSQSRTYSAPTISVSCGDAGSHQHGFSHTHKIATHSHGLNSHTHTYGKAEINASAAAITSLSTSTYTPHTHASNVSVAGAYVDGDPLKYLDGGSTVSVVRDLKTSDVSTNNGTATTDEVTITLTGDIKFPGLSAPTGSVSTSSKSINPAATGTEEALKTITFTSANFVTGLTSKTSKNIGGE